MLLTQLFNRDIEEGTEVERLLGKETTTTSGKKVVFRVHGMTCSSCVSTIENYVSGVKGVAKVIVNLLGEKANVEYDLNLTDVNSIKNAIEELGFQAEVKDEALPGEVTLTLTGLTCASCVNTVESSLKAISGVRSAAVNLMTNKAKVEYDVHVVGPRNLVKAIEELGYGASVTSLEAADQNESKQKEIRVWKRRFWYSMIFAVPTFLIAMILMYVPGPKEAFMTPIYRGLDVADLVLFLLATPVQLWFGRHFHLAAFKALRHKTATMDVLVSLGTNAAYWYSVVAIVISTVNPEFENENFFETAVFLITFLTLGKYMECITKAKTSDAISKLFSLKATTCCLLTLDPEGHTVREESIDVMLIQKGDVLKVLPGERIPTDGEVLDGKSYVDESMITGESLPVQKKKGDTLIGGTVNKEGLLKVRVTKIGGETLLSQIIQLVEDAQTSKAPIQQLADKLSAMFVPAVVFVAVAAFSVWFTLTMTTVVPSSWIPSGQTPFLFSFLFGISVLVIACPCALGLATPTAGKIFAGNSSSLTEHDFRLQ